MDEQLSFFEKNIEFANQENCKKVEGLFYTSNYISQEEETYLFKHIEKETWQKDIKRWTQHYGFQYDYRARAIDYSMKINDLPQWSHFLVEKLIEDKIFSTPPDQLLINNYEIGQGIAPHIDCEPCFEDTIVSLSILSSTILEFSKNKNKLPVFLEPRSLVVIKNNCRYFWKHGIAPRKSDTFLGQTYKRERRISLTFRKVILKS